MPGVLLLLKVPDTSRACSLRPSHGCMCSWHPHVGTLHLMKAMIHPYILMLTSLACSTTAWQGISSLSLTIVFVSHAALQCRARLTLFVSYVFAVAAIASAVGVLLSQKAAGEEDLWLGAVRGHACNHACMHACIACTVGVHLAREDVGNCCSCCNCLVLQLLSVQGGFGCSIQDGGMLHTAETV